MFALSAFNLRNKPLTYPLHQTNAQINVRSLLTGEDFAYLTAAAFPYEDLPENAGNTHPEPGRFTITPVSVSESGTSAVVRLRCDLFGEDARVTRGFLASYKGVDPTAPVAEIPVTLEGDTWFFWGGFGVKDAHEDDPGDGYLNLYMTPGVDGTEAVSVYFA